MSAVLTFGCWGALIGWLAFEELKDVLRVAKRRGAVRPVPPRPAQTSSPVIARTVSDLDAVWERSPDLPRGLR